MARHELVQRVNHDRRAKGSQRQSKRAGQADFEEERDAAPTVAGDQRAVAANEPPTFATPCVGHGFEKAVRLCVGQREVSELFVAIELGDDTRRPTAELSAT